MLINNYATKLGDNSELKLKPPAVCLNKKIRVLELFPVPDLLGKKNVSELYQRYRIIPHMHHNERQLPVKYKFRR